LGVDGQTVEKRAVGAALIDEHVASRGGTDDGVTTGNGARVDREIVVLAAADAAFALDQMEFAAGSSSQARSCWACVDPFHVVRRIDRKGLRKDPAITSRNCPAQAITVNPTFPSPR